MKNRGGAKTLGKSPLRLRISAVKTASKNKNAERKGKPPLRLRVSAVKAVPLHQLEALDKLRREIPFAKILVAH